MWIGRKERKGNAATWEGWWNGKKAKLVFPLSAIHPRGAKCEWMCSGWWGWYNSDSWLAQSKRGLLSISQHSSWSLPNSVSHLFSLTTPSCLKEFLSPWIWSRKFACKLIIILIHQMESVSKPTFLTGPLFPLSTYYIKNDVHTPHFLGAPPNKIIHYL